MGRILVDHRSVPGEGEFDVAGRAAFHLDGLTDDLHVLPAAAIAVLAWVGGVGLVDVEVFLIAGENRETEGDRLVVADGNPRQGGLTGADDIQARRAQLHDVAQRRNAQGPMGIVGQNRPTAGRARRGDHPVV